MLTLHQPWAALVAAGVKTIETRSWETSYRGELLIHAAKTEAASKTPEARLLATGVLRARLWNEMAFGAIVARCQLVDCVPMVTLRDRTPGSCTYLCIDMPDEGTMTHQSGGMWLIGPGSFTRGIPVRVEDQRPYGDYRPGRFAWLLADVVPFSRPIPAKGGQRIWNWRQP